MGDYANETSDELCTALSGTLVGVSQLRIPVRSVDFNRTFFFLLNWSSFSTMRNGAR